MDANHAQLVAPRHIQNMSEAKYMEKHWGYAERGLPCTNDPGSCAYLDLVYAAHDTSLIYSGIMWLVIVGVLVLWAISRVVLRSQRADQVTLASDGEKVTSTTRAATSTTVRIKNSLSSFIRSYLLPDSIRAIFGRTTRLQVLTLTVVFGYILVFSFVNIAWRKWITPVKNNPGVYNTRTSLGPWSDRIGIMAFALTPLSIMLSSRESILSIVTGLPYQSFNFLHRWLGYIIFLQGLFHTISWTIIEARLYQPQPTVAVEWIKQLYMIWGCVAMILLLLLVILSTPWAIQKTGYEFFRKAHYVLALVYIGACIGHWDKLQCFMIPSLILWFIDRTVRLIRTAVLHYQSVPNGKKKGLQPAQAKFIHFPDVDHGDILRMDFELKHDAWRIGEHFYLCFTECSIWQSHPFTPLSLPEVKDGLVTHSYLLRAKGGETKKMAALAAKKLAHGLVATTSVILSGPYGENITKNLTSNVNVLCVAGGTGITYVLPVLLSLIRQPSAMNKDKRIELVWAVRKKVDLRWIDQELSELREASHTHGVVIHVFVTRESTPASSLHHEKGESSSESIDAESNVEVQRLGSGDSPDEHDRHPDLKKIVKEFVENTVCGPTSVFASGPGGMISDLRSIVAGRNDGARVWRGEERFDVRLVCDDRLEW